MAVEFIARLKIQSNFVNMKVQFNSKFSDVIQTLQRAFNEPDISYFEYLDEDNDTVIVSCEDDLQSVFLYYSEMTKEAVFNCLNPPPLLIYAKCELPEQNQNLTILLEGNVSHIDKESNSNTSSSKSNTGSTGGGIFISTTRDEHIMHLAQSDIVPMSPTSEETHDTDRWSMSPFVCDDNVYMIGEIGSGSTGKVMRALHTLTQNVIAVKIIDLDMDKEDTMKQQILSELAVLRLSNSPHIIEFYGAFFVESAIYICTEFMDGYSLDRYGIIDCDILDKLIVLIINGLVYLWSNKIIHRDIKPSNMLISTSGQVKLCDFGISKKLVHSMAKTYTGTISFMSPERLQGESYRISSDVWSLGVSIFILGTGKHPFIDMSLPMTPALMMNCIHVSTGLKSLATSFCTSLSDPMIDFIGRCIEKDPTQRFDPISITAHPIYALNCGNHISELSKWVFDHTL